MPQVPQVPRVPQAPQVPQVPQGQPPVLWQRTDLGGQAMALRLEPMAPLASACQQMPAPEALALTKKEL